MIKSILDLLVPRAGSIETYWKHGNERTLLVPEKHMAFSPDNRLLFTTNGVSGDVTVIDVESLEAVKTIKVGRFPWGAAARPGS